MKNKIITFTLCFTIIFSSINLNKSYAFSPGVVPSAIVGTVGTLAVACGIPISSDNTLYDLSRMFYDKYKDSEQHMRTLFSLCVGLSANGLVNVSSDFLTLVKDFFDDFFITDSDVNYGSGNSLYNLSVPISSLPYEHYFTSKLKLVIGSLKNYDSSLNVYVLNDSTWSKKISTSVTYDTNPSSSISSSEIVRFTTVNGNFKFYIEGRNGTRTTLTFAQLSRLSDSYKSFTIPYNGTYSPNGVLDNDNVSIYVPGDLSDLVGSSPSDVIYDGTFNPPYDLPVGGVVTVPGVDNPSIDIDDSISFPLVDSPSVDSPSVDSPFSSVTDYIISLVVPSDSYWTDTWDDLYNNFTNSFPLVDMSNFDKLVTGEKKFPNIDINIMGVSGRVVNGDVVNSIVDWLRPIVAGFMMLCLMLFNYRKIYKTIRGVEPFQGIAQGTSDFRTGISEYNYMGTGLSKADYEANQMELSKALYDYEQDTGKTYKIKI